MNYPCTVLSVSANMGIPKYLMPNLHKINSNFKFLFFRTFRRLIYVSEEVSDFK